MIDDPHSEFIRKPLWRTRTTALRRRVAAALACALTVLGGSIILAVVMAALVSTGAPGWVVALPWMIPTAVTLAWSMRQPAPAVAVSDDDVGWTEYSIRLVMVGEDQRRGRPLRAIVAVVLGAPLGWMLLVFVALSLLGIF